MSYRANIISVENSVSNLTLGANQGWTGKTQDVTQYSSASIALKSTNSTSGTVYYETSMDKNRWAPVPRSITNSAGSVPYIFTVTQPYIRIRYENGAQEVSGLTINTMLANARSGELGSVMSQSPNDSTPTTIVKAVITGKQPDGDYVDEKSDGTASSLATTIASGATVSSGWIDTDGFNSLRLIIVSDQLSADNGIKVEYTDDVQGTPSPTTRVIEYYTYRQAEIDRGYLELNTHPKLDGLKWSYTNGPISCNFFGQLDLKTNTDSNEYNSGKALIVGDFDTEVSIGNVNNYFIDTKFGRNPIINTNSDPEDIWNGGAIYTGHPIGFTPETVTITSSSGNDTLAGTGARSISIFGLKTSASTSYESEDLSLSGISDSISTNTWWRVNRAYVSTAGSGGENEGSITIKSTTTTANVFAVVPPTYSQTQTAAYTVPNGKLCLIKRTNLSIVRASGAAGSASATLRARTLGGVYRAIRSYELQTGNNVDTTERGGTILPSGTDIKFTIETVSDNATIAVAEFEFLLLDALAV